MEKNMKKESSGGLILLKTKVLKLANSKKRYLTIPDYPPFESIKHGDLASEIQSFENDEMIKISFIFNKEEDKDKDLMYNRKDSEKDPILSPGYIYFIQAETEGLIKIGCSTSTESRLKQLQHASPVKLKLLKRIKGNETDEEKIQTRFKEFCDHGEWFIPDKSLLSFIDSLKE